VKSELIVARRAMNTEFSITIPAATPNAIGLGCAALDEIDRLEDLLSFFRPDSEISRLNRGERPANSEVSDLLAWATRISAATQHAFDAQFAGKWNLGAIGKGYAIDAALRHIRPQSALMQGGQSSIAAVGTWTVALGDPPFARLKLTNQAIGTSGEQFQPGHILDPRTGRPAHPAVMSATCIAPTATEADAFSTAFYVMGPAATRRFCRANPRLGAILHLPNGKVEVIR
jgi:thiamine biosynthesis lipoprotein